MVDYGSNRVITSDENVEAEHLLFGLLANSVPDQSIADLMKVSGSAIAAIRKVAKAIIEPEAGAVDDLLVLIDQWHAQDPSIPFFFSQGSPDAAPDEEGGALSNSSAGADTIAKLNGANNRSHLLDEVARDLTPADMRSLASSMLKLADALDQDWAPELVRSRYHWASKAGRLERNSVELAKIAVRVQDVGRRRERHLPSELLGEPSWQMLLELFIQFAGGAKVSTKNLCIISGCPDTTALRLIDRLEQAGLIRRAPSEEDKRVTLLELTQKGVVSVGSALQDLKF